MLMWAIYYNNLNKVVPLWSYYLQWLLFRHLYRIWSEVLRADGPSEIMFSLRGSISTDLNCSIVAQCDIQYWIYVKRECQSVITVMRGIVWKNEPPNRPKSIFVWEGTFRVANFAVICWAQLYNYCYVFNSKSSCDDSIIVNIAHYENPIYGLAFDISFIVNIWDIAIL